MDFPFYFKKVILPGRGKICDKQILKKPNTPEYALVLVVTWVKLDFDMPFYHPRYLQARKLINMFWTKNLLTNQDHLNFQHKQIRKQDNQFSATLTTMSCKCQAVSHSCSWLTNMDIWNQLGSPSGPSGE